MRLVYFTLTSQSWLGFSEVLVYIDFFFIDFNINWNFAIFTKMSISQISTYNEIITWNNGNNLDFFRNSLCFKGTKITQTSTFLHKLIKWVPLSKYKSQFSTKDIFIFSAKLFFPKNPLSSPSFPKCFLISNFCKMWSTIRHFYFRIKSFFAFLYIAL